MTKVPPVAPKGRAEKARPFAQKSPGEVIWENVRGLVVVAILFLVFRTFVIQAYRIPSSSMVPTLLVGDWLFVDNLIYGPYIPFTSSHLPSLREPRRHDVVVFVSPYQADEAARGNDPTPTLVKRLIGLPGDTLYMRNAVLYINGVQQHEPYVRIDSAAQDGIDPLFVWQNQYVLHSSRFGAPPVQTTHDNWGPLVVPAGHYFMMGDNRYDSKDSRYWGFVPRENIRGQPMFVYFAYNADDSDSPVPFITDIRWSRLGHWIR